MYWSACKYLLRYHKHELLITLINGGNSPLLGNNTFINGCKRTFLTNLEVSISYELEWPEKCLYKWKYLQKRNFKFKGVQIYVIIL